uniref:BSD2 cysteine rich domain-containing protein n=1 Tax=Kalanchoe fedtschenkoi TaxID=63787 RepID=A0A7N0VJJ9_KALFE
MASAVRFAAANCFNANPVTKNDSTTSCNIHQKNCGYRHNWAAPMGGRRCVLVTATDDKGGGQSPKPRSVLCTDCDGNGAVICSQCKGGGVNQADFFNGQFKVGDACWLCGGKKDVLCGNCNGAGFIGGFMSTFDE